MISFRVLGTVLVCVSCLTAEVTLDLPEPLIPGAQMNGVIKVIDPMADVRSLTLPPVPGLYWEMSGQNSSQTSIINRKRSTTVSIGLILRAEQRGILDLPAVAIELSDGSTLTTTPRQIHVADGDARLIGEALAEASFDPATIVPGQPTKLVLRVWLRRGEIEKLGIAPPDGTISLGERTVTQSRTFDAAGQAWNVFTVTWPLTHAAPGTCTVRGQQEYQDVVGQGIFNQRVIRRQVAIAPATLTVAQLPSEGRPASYYGLIGPLTTQAILDRERVSTGEGVTLTITVAGRQTGLVKRPALTIADAQLYPKNEQTTTGSRIFSWDVVPVATGTMTIPSVSIPYFDPGSASYRNAETAELKLLVTPGRSRDLGMVGSTLAPHQTQPLAHVVAPTLPAPIKGAAPVRAPLWSANVALTIGLGSGFGVLLLRRWLGGQRGPHRGRVLRAAGRDLTALDAALRTLRPALTTDQQRAAADELQRAIDQARFGGGALPDLTGWLTVLGQVP